MPPYKANNMILFHIHDAQLVISNRRAIKKWIQGIIESHDKRTRDINIIFCRSDYLLELNKKYLEHDYYTDVITFPYSEEKKVSGDIFIDVDTVACNAETFRQSFGNELLRVMIHGVLHLLGLDDNNEENAHIMRKAEDTALTKITVDPVQ